MPATVQVKVVAARDLPIMDRSSELTDAFVELKLGQAYEKTEVCEKTLNPSWDSKWFTFKVEEEDLQEEPLQIKIMDHDTYSAHNAIGKVYISLNSLIATLADGASHSSSSSSMDGWFPIFDTLHGIRGELRLQVKVEVLRDQHRFKQSSCEVAFFTCPETPLCYATQSVHGFVEELVVNDDPEYKWIDKIRTPRASNEARQRLFSKITGELQRKIGLKALDIGGNAVIGYQQYFDLEGDTGIVVRGIGTCVSLAPKSHSPFSAGQSQLQVSHGLQGGISGLQTSNQGSLKELDAEGGREGGGGSGGGAGAGGAGNVMVSPKNPLTLCKTSSSGSEGVTGSPHKGSASESHIEALTPGPLLIKPPPIIPVASSDFPFYTLTNLPPGLLLNIGGVVSSRSVKLLDKIKDPDEPETRDAWWQEVRNEVRSHAQAMGCNAVAGYVESTSICDALCIFSATGTAVRISTNYHLPSRQSPRKPASPGSSAEDQKEADAGREAVASILYQLCRICHIPYSPIKQFSGGRLVKCCVCNSGTVPSILLSTLEPPPSVAIRGRGTLIQVRVLLNRKRLKGEENAIDFSKQLPFLEYKLYTRLLNKVRIKGMNAVFSLSTQYIVGDTVVIGMATGTGLFLEALPSPTRVVIAGKDAQFDTLQEAISTAQEENTVLYGLKQPLDISRGGVADSSFGEEDTVGGGIEAGPISHQDTLLFDVEDSVLKEEDIVEIILDRPIPKDFYVANTNFVPGIDPALLCTESRIMTIVAKKNLEPGKDHLEKQCSQAFDQLNQVMSFKVRKMSPAVLTKVHFIVDLPEDDVLQVAVTAMVTKIQTAQSAVPKSQSDEMIFSMEDTAQPDGIGPTYTEAGTEEINAGAVRITPLPSLCGYHVQRYLRIVNFFLIRESTSIRENGGLDSFMHLFVLEAQAIARAHVAAVGGNALLNYRLNDLVLIEHPHKNQAQCLLNVSGDAALLVLNSPTMSLHAAGGSTDLSVPMENPGISQEPH